MKKKMMVVIGAAVLFMLCGQVAYAQEAGRWAVGVNVSYLGISDEDFDGSLTGTDAEFDGAVHFEGDLSYFVTDVFSVELGIGYAKTDVDISAAGMASLSLGELSQTPLTLTGRYHFVNDSGMIPFIGAGVGYYFNNFDPNQVILGILGAGAGTDVEADNGFGFHVNGGVDFFFNENMSLGIDLKYRWSGSELQVTDPVNGNEDFDIDLNAFIAGAAFKSIF